MALERIEVKNPMGIVTDTPSGDLPLEVWSDANNVSFKNGICSKSLGIIPVFGDPRVGSPIIGVQPYLSGSTPYWILGSSSGLFRTAGGFQVSVSRPGAPYNASESNPWVGGVLHDVIIMNNGVDIPQAMAPQVSTFVDLPNWPANTTAKIVRPFKNYLVALNVTRNSVDFPTMVKWSSPADPGQVPFTWDPTNPTNDAGEVSLGDTPGKIVDGIKLRDSFIVYKDDSVYSMRYIGGIFIFSFQKLFNDVGILSKNCAVEFDGNHFVVGHGDVYVHNGVQKRSVIDGAMRDFLYADINAEHYDRAFVVPDHIKTEMWLCYPNSDSPNGYCNRVLVWNWSNGKWSKRDLPMVFCGSYGILDPQINDEWEFDNTSWDTDRSTWGSASYNPSKTTLLFSSTSNRKLYSVADTALIDDRPFTSYLEKTGVSLGDSRNMKVVSSIIPHISGSGLCRITIGTSVTQRGPIEWKPPVNYIIGTDYKADIKAVGRYLSIRFEFPSQGVWSLNGYTVEMAPTSGMK